MEEMKKQAGQFHWADPAERQVFNPGNHLMAVGTAGTQPSTFYSERLGKSTSYNASNVLTASSNP